MPAPGATGNQVGDCFRWKAGRAAPCGPERYFARHAGGMRARSHRKPEKPTWGEQNQFASRHARLKNHGKGVVLQFSRWLQRAAVVSPPLRVHFFGALGK